MKTYTFGDLTLLPQRAVWRAATKTLFVADVHLGKAATFRAAGLPAPAGTTRENLGRLDALIDALDPRRLVVLGDLFHASAAYRDASLGETLAWRRRRAALAVTLVAGNHDVRAGAPPAALGLECVDDPYRLDGLECRHAPCEGDPGAGPPLLAGHIHPAARLFGPGRDRVRLPCFVLRGRQIVLPAFGEFTGAALVTPDAQTSLCIAAGDQFVFVAPQAAARLARDG